MSDLRARSPYGEKSFWGQVTDWSRYRDLLGRSPPTPTVLDFRVGAHEGEEGPGLSSRVS